MTGWWRSRTGKILLLGGLCVLAQQIAIAYRVDFLGASANASLIHLHAGLLLAIALLETDRRVVIGVVGVTALGWAVRQWNFAPGDWQTLLWGSVAWVVTGAWTLACARWAGWPREPDSRRVDRRGLGQLALVGLLVYPAGWALLGGTVLVIEQPAVALSSIFQMFFAKQFGVAVVTFPLMVAWTERRQDAPNGHHNGWAGWLWPLLLIGGLLISLWSSYTVRQGIASPAVVLMDYRFALFVVLAWFVLRLPPRRSMPALAAALFCLVYAVSGAAEYGNTPLGLLNLLHLTLEVDILLLAMLYLWVISRDRRELSQRLGEESLRDTVTGLPNLRALRARMRSAPPLRRELGFLLLDQADTLLTGFGLDSQAAVMESTAARLSDLADVYYLGTGQFALVPLLRSDDDVWERMVARVEHAEFHADDQPVRLLPYLGVASLSSSPADTVDAALLTASHLAFDARQHGEVRPRYSDLDDDRLRESHRQQMTDAAQALSCLRNERLVLHFQPIRRLAQADESQPLISGEVLCRLRDDDGRLIPPARFMRPIEAAGRGAELDLAVIKALFRQLRRYPEALPYCERIAINLTGQSLASISFQIELRTLLADAPLPLSALCFEVTETAAISSTSMASRLLRDLRSRGCQIAIDDFGTGMQSFSRLKELPVDIIKIDGSFVRNVAQRGSDYAVVQATVAVANVFGAETIAEFVENRHTAECLRELDVDWVQGDLYARPRPLSEVLADALPRELSLG